MSSRWSWVVFGSTSSRCDLSSAEVSLGLVLEREKFPHTQGNWCAAHVQRIRQMFGPRDRLLPQCHGDQTSGPGRLERPQNTIGRRRPDVPVNNVPFGRCVSRVEIGTVAPGNTSHLRLVWSRRNVSGSQDYHKRAANMGYR
jgi:hypothetical protein